MQIRLDTVSVCVPVDGQVIQGTVLAPASRLPGVLFVHGWGGHQKHDLARAREAAALGCVCLTFDLRGHEATAAQSDRVNRPQNLADLVAAYDWLAARPDVDGDAIAVVGLSYGGYLATLLTSLRLVRWLALRSPALYKDNGWELPKKQLHEEQDLMAYRRLPHIEPANNRALRAAAAFTGDALLVEAEHDTIVPRTVLSNYRHAFAASHSLTYRVIAGADHAMKEKTHQREYGQVLIHWLTEMIGGARTQAAAERIRAHKRAPAANLSATNRD